MTAALLTGLAIAVAGLALRPRPVARRAAEPIARRRRTPGNRASRRSRTNDATEAADVAAWCEAMARLVRSGSTLAAAIRTAEPSAPAADQVAAVLHRLERGARLADALQVSSGSRHVELALTVLRACAINGGPPAEPLDRAATALRGRARDAAERRTQSAQARLSALVMTVLPMAMLAVLLATSPATRAASATPAGLLVVGLGAVLNLVGWRWMRRIIERAAS